MRTRPASSRAPSLVLPLTQHDPPARAAVADVGERGHELGDREDRGRARLDLSGAIEREELAEAYRHLARHALAVVADLEPADFDVLHQQIVRLDDRNAPGREADHHQPAAPGDGADGGLENVAAERVEN